MQKGKGRATVRVSVPEGYTIDKIAALLEEKEVCAADEFYRAVRDGDFSEYDFIAEIPTAEPAEKYGKRIHRLEGYLFPDTYEFYKSSSGEAAVRKFLDNFKTRIGPTYKSKFAAKNMTVDEVITLASIIQAEAGDGEWSWVSRVLRNRMDNPNRFTKLECDATRDYITRLDKSRLPEGVTADMNFYDTYLCTGLPAGPIGSPGLNAINAVLDPSADPKVLNCFYFATDLSTGITYYTKTLAEHEAICRQYKIGMYA
jgi:UPF0755 protein